MSLIGNAGARLAGALSLVLLLAGCQTTNYAGTGPLRLSQRATDFLQKYLSLHNGAAFAISEDGRYYTYRYCPQASCVEGDHQYFAVQNCESNSKRTCKILAVGRKVVWQGPVTTADGRLLNP